MRTTRWLELLCDRWGADGSSRTQPLGPVVKALLDNRRQPETAGVLLNHERTTAVGQNGERYHCRPHDVAPYLLRGLENMVEDLGEDLHLIGAVAVRGRPSRRWRSRAAGRKSRVGRQLETDFGTEIRRRDGAMLSRPDYQDSGWHEVRRMPATVLQILQENGTYPNLYFGKNLLEDVPQDLYKQDWWYRTTFQAPAGHSTYLLEFPGINYRAEIWLNGDRVADNKQVVGMYSAHELNVTQSDPARRIELPGGQGHSGVGAPGHRRCGTGGQLVRLDQLEIPRIPGARQEPGQWKFVRSGPQCRNLEARLLEVLGCGGPRSRAGELRTAATRNRHRATYRPLESPQLLDAAMSGGSCGPPSRGPASPTFMPSNRSPFRPARIGRSASLPNEFAQLTVVNPDLWWPYTMGEPNLYDLRLEFQPIQSGNRCQPICDSASGPSLNTATRMNNSPNWARAATFI